jgi:DNA ligase (NAD+)
VLYALGIRFVGETVAKKLAFAFSDIDSIKSASREELMGVEEIGEKIAESVIGYFRDEGNIRLIERLKDKGIRFRTDRQSVEVLENRLGGKSFVVSGVFSRFSREELKDLIEKYGGRNVGSVSSKTDFLLAGEGMGPAKMKKAQELGLKVISEEDFVAMISGNTDSHLPDAG